MGKPTFDLCYSEEAREARGFGCTSWVLARRGSVGGILETGWRSDNLWTSRDQEKVFIPEFNRE
jgi:hypothetical protein